MHKHKYITISEAVKMHEGAGLGTISYDTVRRWLRDKDYDLGAFKIVGKWRLDKDKFQKLLEGDYGEKETAEEHADKTG